VVGNVTNEIVGVEVVVGAGISVTQNKCIYPILFIYVQRSKYYCVIFGRGEYFSSSENQSFGIRDVTVISFSRSLTPS
jgi:hypothetical protein